ncbi:IS66 Orf2 like protein [Pseudomonas sp. LP_7_YM]|nr:IS66 Orf2 like protein [Pseudomonas sp. LP_7_YM]
MMRPDASVEKVYLYPKPVDFRKSIDGLAALVELDIKVAVFDPVLFVFLNRHRNRVNVQYWERKTPQLALFNEPESEPMPWVGDADERSCCSDIAPRQTQATVS